MNSFAIFFVACFAFACVAASPVEQKENSKAAAPVSANDASRQKRFFPFAPAVGTVSGYSYLAPYANSGKIVHYPPPVLSTYAAAVPAVSTYHALPAVSTYHALPAVSTYHALPAVSTYHAPLAVSAYASPLSSYHLY